MKCERCSGRWWAKDKDGERQCLTCGRLQEQRPHEEPQREARTDSLLKRYVRER